MKYSFIISFFFICVSAMGCSKGDSPGNPGPGKGDGTTGQRRPASIGIIGDTANVIKPVNGGLVLMGGGTDVSPAFKWMMDRSGGGDVVIIRVSGADAYNDYINKMGNVNSVETLKIDTRELANNDTVVNIIRNAEMLFIAGGDQSAYMNLWKGTKTEAALNYLLQEKKAPFGGTSAGCAIMGAAYFSGENGSVVSDDALANPFATNINLYYNDFLHAPYLENVITDQHYVARSREGRSVVFLGRIQQDFKVLTKGIAMDERTAVCIDKDGKAQVFGSSSAYFILPDAAKLPEQFSPSKPVIWKHNNQAIQVYEITGTLTGNGNFNLANFNTVEAAGGSWFWWSVDNGKLVKSQKNL
jgi:cyanophycinase